MVALTEVVRARIAAPGGSSDERFATGSSSSALFRPAIEEWMRAARPEVVFEIGGGRTPMFDVAEGTAMGVVRYIVNDISQAELDRLPEGYETACFDIQTSVPIGADYAGKCDLVLSHFVFEHVKDPSAAWKATSELLRPGGVAIAFIPVLFSPPFVVNRLLPERLTARVLRFFFPHRNEDGRPKFPAYYRWCRASQQYMNRRLRPLGFSRVDVIPFYGHGYFDQIPGIRQLDARLTHAAGTRAWETLASYAYVIVTK